MTFNQAFKKILTFEGGYSNDSNDPGGETKFGISKKSYPDLNIEALTLEDVKKIYRKDYWEAASCDKLPPSIALLIFDSAINQGVKTAIKLLQKSLGVKKDGIIGPKTLKAAKMADERELKIEFLSQRALLYTQTKDFDRYGRGWMRRLFELGVG